MTMSCRERETRSLGKGGKGVEKQEGKTGGRG